MFDIIELLQNIGCDFYRGVNFGFIQNTTIMLLDFREIKNGLK